MCVCVCVCVTALFTAGAAHAQTTVCENPHQIFPSHTQAHDYYGSSASIESKHAVVGWIFRDDAGIDAGAARFYYYRETGGGWTGQHRVFPEHSLDEEGDNFGSSVAISGEAAAIGAGGYPNGAENGAVFIFRRDSQLPLDQQWQQETILTATDGVSGDQLGGSEYAHGAVAMDGNIVAAAAPTASVSSTTEAGKVYIFVYDPQADQWSEEAILDAGNDVQTEANFGFSVSLNGSVLVVGAPNQDGAAVDTGAAHVFVRDTTVSPTVWTRQAVLTDSAALEGDRFGFSVSNDSGEILIGAPGSSSEPGFASLYERDSIGWSLLDLLTASDGAAGEEFGYSVSLSGSLAVVGSRTHSYHAGGTQYPTVEAGAAYVFQRNLTGTTEDWQEVLELLQAPAVAHDTDRFGEVVAINGDDIFVTALGDEPANDGPGDPPVDPPGGPDVTQYGALYIFTDLPTCSPEDD